jgi:hypothetical protein
MPDVDSGVPVDVDAGRVGDAGSLDSGSSMDAAMDFDAGLDDAGRGADASIDAGPTFDAGMTFDAGLPMGFPNVDRTSPQLYRFQFTAQAAEPDAGRWTGNQLARLDTRVAPRGLLVVYLHGAGTPTTWASATARARPASSRRCGAFTTR